MAVLSWSDIRSWPDPWNDRRGERRSQQEVCNHLHGEVTQPQPGCNYDFCTVAGTDERTPSDRRIPALAPLGGFRRVRSGVPHEWACEAGTVRTG